MQGSDQISIQILSPLIGLPGSVLSRVLLLLPSWSSKQLRTTCRDLRDSVDAQARPIDQQSMVVNDEKRNYGTCFMPCLQIKHYAIVL